MAFAGDIPLQRRFTLRAEGHRYPPAENELCLSEGVNPTRGAYLERPLQMTTTETYRYRGYDIVPMWQWSSWCTGIYPTRADLPILSQSTLSTMAPEKCEAVEEAKHCIDRILSRLT